MNTPYDAAVVLGAAVNSDGSASSALLRRLAHGIRLYENGRVCHLLMSGGGRRGPPSEAALMKAAALAAGVPEAAVITEERSRNTLENALFSKPIVDGQGWRRVLLVTDGYHLPRALYTFRRLGVAADGAAAPPPPLGRNLVYCSCREVIAYGIYLWRIARLP